MQRALLKHERSRRGIGKACQRRGCRARVFWPVCRTRSEPAVAVFVTLSERLALRASARAAARNSAKPRHRKNAGALGTGGSRRISLRNHGGAGRRADTPSRLAPVMDSYPIFLVTASPAYLSFLSAD